jgi:hypothetical protein
VVRRGGRARLIALAGFLLAAAVVALGLLPAAAQAAPRKPTAIQIVGAGLPGGKVIIRAKDKPQLFSMMLSEVSWLATATPQTSAPRTSALGPKYTVTVLVRNSAQQVYDLYPSAVGGPRAHRPSKQPTGKKADGWFFGRLTMSETLRLAGAPLVAKTDVITGGIGGGVPTDVVNDVASPPTVTEMIAQLRQLLLLNGAVLIVIVAGMGGIAYLIRRKV